MPVEEKHFLYKEMQPTMFTTCINLHSVNLEHDGDDDDDDYNDSDKDGHDDNDDYAACEMKTPLQLLFNSTKK